ncbi:MAG: YihA family ribosome biogenesis GTP-binding protein [Bacteroidetes bacterium]|nr:YihA family ribosome biogenesis GTP-binding protein [Bacteroidota bacterium]
MQIKKAIFAKSSAKITECPKPVMPEYAFIGRSNVGKSSLINMLCNNNKLAHTSSTPGKTKIINHFLINDNWYLVDLPGYGYAKTSKVVRGEFEKIITDYITTRSNLVCLFVLVDYRLPLQQIDAEFMEWLGKKNVPFCIVFTKADKLSKSELKKNLENYLLKVSYIFEDEPNYIITSAEKKTGKEDLLEFIEAHFDLFKRDRDEK